MYSSDFYFISFIVFFFFFKDTATTEIYTLSLHDALPIANLNQPRSPKAGWAGGVHTSSRSRERSEGHTSELQSRENLVCRLLLEKKKTLQRSMRQKPPIETLWAALIGKDAAAAYRVICRLSQEPRNSLFFFFNDTATTEIYTLSLHDALPISR